MPTISRAAARLISLIMLCALSSYSAAQQHAPIMPLASRSLLLDITIAGERLFVAGERGHILYSDDRGSSWHQAKVATAQMLTGIHAIDGGTAWAVGHDGVILISDDQGETWRVQRDGLAMQQQTNLENREQAHQQIKQLEQQLQSADEDSLPDLEMALEDAQFDLEDAELALTEPVFTSPLMDVWFQDARRGWATGAFGELLATRDGGSHWQNIAGQLDNPDEFHLNAITGDGKGRVFIAGEGGVMFRSMDGGNSWETIEPFYDGSWFGLVYSAPHDALLAFGLRGNLYRSTDFGDTWNMVPSDNTITLAGGSTSPGGDIVLAGGVGTVLSSTDGGQTFKRTMIEDRLSLSSGMRLDGRLVLIGQGGAKIREDDS